MKFSSLKLAGALLASFAMVSAGPAWSATDAPKAEVKSVAKHKVKAKTKARIHAKTKARVNAKTEKAVVASAVVAPVAVAMVPLVAVVSEAVAQPSPVQTSYAPVPTPAPVGNPYLAYQQQTGAVPVTVNPWDNVSKLGSNLKSLLPSMPEGQSFLPSIKKVYPTGEKPLVVLTFKCPTELIGITPIPVKLLHEGVNGVFDVVNATNLLSFNMQQVCQ